METTHHPFCTRRAIGPLRRPRAVPLEAEDLAVLWRLAVLVDELDALVLVAQPELTRLVLGDGLQLLTLVPHVSDDGLLHRGATTMLLVEPWSVSRAGRLSS